MVLLSFANKLRVLAIKTFADTIINAVKETNHPSKLKQLVINLGQTSHKVITKMERRSHGLANDTPIHKLDEKKAIHAGSLFLAELSLYTVAGVTVILGVQSYVSAIKEEKQRKELQAIVMELTELHTQKQLELHEAKQLQPRSLKNVEAAPNRVELDQMLDEMKELLKKGFAS